MIPLHDRLVVERIEEARPSGSMIVIPDSVKPKSDRGRVLAVGRGYVNRDGDVRPLDVQVGDVVLFGKFAGQDVEIAGQARVILREDEILVILERSVTSAKVN